MKTVVSSQVGVENQTQALCKSPQVLLITEPDLQPLEHFFAGDILWKNLKDI